MPMQLVREATSAAVGVASELVGEAPVLSGLGVTKGLAVELTAVAAGLVLDSVIKTVHAHHAGDGLLHGGLALIGRRAGVSLPHTAPYMYPEDMGTLTGYQNRGLQASTVASNHYQFV